MYRTRYTRKPRKWMGFNIGSNREWYSTFYKCRNVIFGIIVMCFLIILHTNYKSDSYLDHLFYKTCENITCSLTFGIIENILWVSLLFVSYFIIFNLFWKLRYKYNEYFRHKFEYFNFLDPYILSCPWLMSPILSFHCITSCIIDICILYVAYKQHFRETEEEDVDSSILINYQQQKCNLCRTFCSFIFWMCLDCYLWRESSLLFLFEKGPNKALSAILPSYIKSIKNELLPHVSYINDLSSLIMSFLDTTNWKLIEMKDSIYNNLNKSNLNEPFLCLSVINAVISGYRLYMTPTVSVVLFPLMIILGIIAFILLIIFMVIAIFGGGGGGGGSTCDCCDDCDGCCRGNNCDCCDDSGSKACCKQCPFCAKFYAFLGMLFAAALWTAFVWFIMKLKLNKLNKIQSQSYKKYSKYKYQKIRLLNDDDVDHEQEWINL